MVSAHGLASSIRSAEESETFDLGGHNESSITSVIEAAFKEPFEIEDMIRITFVVGAGKQARQRYDDAAAKAVTLVLDKYGYNDDRGASCVLECSGSYKLQHDTGKNLKTVVVFPKVAKSNLENSANQQAEPIIPEDSPEYKLAVSSINVFKNMVNAKCPSWSQKKGCLGAIETLKESVRELDTKLMNGEPLDAAEQAFYDAVTLLDEKEGHVRHELNQIVETGNITKFEQDLLKEHNAEKIAALEKEDRSTTKALQRKDLLESIDPVPPHRLKFEAEIGKLRKELAPLLQMEEGAKGRLLTVKETQVLARKDEILDEIACLEEASRGWFEDDAAFESRVLASRQSFASRKSKKALKTTTVNSGTKVKVPVNKWITPGDEKGWAKTSAKKKKGKMKGGAVFTAMMMDSDDDDDDEEEGASTEEEVAVGENENFVIEEVATTKKKAKKKKKKGKGKQETKPRNDDASNESETKERESAIAQTSALFQTYLLPLLVSFLGWIIALVFGKRKKKGGGTARN